MTTNSTDTCIEFRGNTNGTGEKRSLRVSLNEKLRNVFYGITGENILSKNILLSGGIAAFIENYFRLEKMQVNVLMGEKDGFPGLLELELDTKLAAIKDVVFGFTDKFQAESGNVSGFNPEKILRSNVFFSFSESANRNELPFAENALLFSFDFSVDAVSLELRWHDGKQDPSSISEFLNHFLGFFEEVLVEKRAIRDSSFFSIDWSKRYVRNGASGSKNPLSVLDRFHAICESFPSQISILHEDEQLTYEELQQRSSTVANWLRSKGVQRGDLIYTHMKRSPELIIVLLGIIKTGAFFSMLEPDLSLQRKRDILDVDPGRFVIGEENLEGELIQLPNYAEMSVVLSGPVESVESMEEFIPLETDRLYMIFTSGTTGQPKGVVVRNKSFGNRMNWMHKQYDLNRDSVTLVKSSLTFDPFICEVFRSLTSGATLGIVPGHENVSDPSVLLKYTAKYKATNMDLVASPLKILAHYLVENPDESSKAQSLKHIFAGAEPLDSRVWSSISQSLCVPFGTTLINTWGATETTVDVTAFNCGDSFGGSILPVGYPIDGVELLLLDEWGVQVPDGIVGELYIGGEVLAEGYFKDSDLTSRKFVRLPDYGGGVYYKSGDYAYNTIDGPTYFLGRKDDQLKINGFRIELTDIINRIQKIEGVAKAAAKYDKPHGLIVAIERKESGTDEKIKKNIREQLSQIPFVSVLFDRIPLTINEKVDWNSIIEKKNLESSSEEMISDHPVANIWKEVLQKEVFESSDFFELGGDSIGIALVKMKMKKVLGVELTVEQLFQHSGLKDHIELADKAKPVVNRKGITGPDRLNYEATNFQKLIWYASQTQEGSRSYNIPLAFELRGNLDVEKLFFCFRNIVQEHNLLRTSFKMENGTLRCVVSDTIDFHRNIRLVDHRSISEEQTQELLAQFQSETFDLNEPGQINLLVIQKERSFILCFKAHHIVFDAWSIAVFIQELTQKYQADSFESLPELPIQFGDYAHYKNTIATERKAVNDLFWELRKDSAAVKVSLPYDTHDASSKQKKYLGNTLHFSFNEIDLPELEKTLNEHKNTLFNLLCSALSLYFSKLTGSDRMVIGTPVSDRDESDFMNLIGPLIETVPLFLAVNENRSFEELMAEHKKETSASFTHKDYDWDTDTADLFKTMIVLQNGLNSKMDVSIEGIAIEGLEDQTGTSKSDAIFTFYKHENKLQLSLQFNTELYQTESILEFVKQFEYLLSDLIRQPLKKICDHVLIPFLDVDAGEFNYSGDTFLDLFRESVSIYGEKEAVLCKNERITYTDLDNKSNTVASALTEKFGEIREQKMGVLLTKSIDCIAVIIGILKCGGVYVPMDPTMPAERLNYIQENANLALIITEDEPGAGLSADSSGFQLIDKDVLLSHPNQSFTYPDVKPEQLAYIIHTSGSTGLPKGIMIEHGQLRSLLDRRIGPFEFDSTDVWSCFHSLNFDFSIWEIFMPLAFGAKLVLLQKDEIENSLNLVSAIEEKEITVFSQVPASFASLVDSLEFNDFPALQLRYVVFGGDQINPAAIRKFSQNYYKTKLINGYGLTEATVFSTFKDIDVKTIQRSNIGRVIASQEVRIYNKDMQPVSYGEIGDIYLGGVGIMRGIVGDLNRSRFVLHPKNPTKFLLKTGDKGRFFNLGDIQYEGREDNQIKLRGYRIELEEIVNALEVYPEIVECQVLFDKDEKEERLVAFLLTHSTEIDTREVRLHLKGKLPEYMIPEVIRIKHQFPKNHSGKTDKKRLLSDFKKESADNNENPPQVSADTETYIIQLWEKLLDIKKPEPTDNFFSIGGHSLLAIKLVSEIKEYYQVKLTIGDIFSTPVLEDFIQLVQLKLGSFAPKAGLMKQAPALEYYPTIVLQKQFWRSAFYADDTLKNIPFIVKIEAILEEEIVRKTILALSAYHEALRTNFKYLNDEVYQFIRPEIDLSKALKWAGLSSQEAYDQLSFHVFDLEADPVFRCYVIPENESTTILFLLHHIVSDGVSLEILKRDFMLFYEMIRLEQELPSSPPFQFKDYCWNVDTETKLGVENQVVNYWKEELKDIKPQLFNGQKEDSTFHEHSGKMLKVSMDKDFSDQILALVQEKDWTVYHFLYASLALLLAQKTGKTDISILSPFSIRTDKKTENLIGLFINTFPVRIQVDQSIGANDFVDAVSTKIKYLMDFVQLPFEHVTQHIEDWDQSTRFDVGFTLQSQILAGNSFSSSEIEEHQKADKMPTNLWFDMALMQNGVDCIIFYSDDLWMESEIRELWNEYTDLIQSILADPSANPITMNQQDKLSIRLNL